MSPYTEEQINNTKAAVITIAIIFIAIFLVGWWMLSVYGSTIPEDDKHQITDNSTYVKTYADTHGYDLQIPSDKLKVYQDLKKQITG